MTEDHEKDKQYEMVKKLRPGRIVLPVLIGLAVVVWFMTKDMNLSSLKEITFTWKSVFWLTVAVFFILLRTFGYVARIRVLTDNKLTWLQSLRVILLWEFTSAVTPSTVGGTAFAVIFLNKEGISVGKSTSVALVTSFLDEFYFMIMFPVIVLIVGWESLFITSFHGVSNVMNNLVFVAVIGYITITAWVLIVGYGLFFKPVAIKNILIWIFKLPILRRWQNAVEKAGDDIIITSNELKKKSASFWWKAGMYTFITWTSRYVIIIVILTAFFAISDHLLIFARELVLWIMMIISPTPGGSGFAEIILGRYISDLIPVDNIHAQGISLGMTIIWRFITYYPFLIAGAIILPGWVRKNFINPSRKK